VYFIALRIHKVLQKPEIFPQQSSSGKRSIQ